MRDFTTKEIEFLYKIRKMKFKDLSFKRGLGIIEDSFILSFVNSSNELHIEVESNFRIRDSKDVFLTFNDLYIDKKGRELSVRRYRSQLGIEKTYLSKAIDDMNKRLSNVLVKDIIIEEYGDIYIYFVNGIVIEVFNDTHLEDATLYRVTDNQNNSIKEYEIQYKEKTLVIYFIKD